MTNDEAVAYCVANGAVAHWEYNSEVQITVHGSTFTMPTLVEAVEECIGYELRMTEAEQQERQAWIDYPLGTQVLALLTGNEIRLIVQAEAYIPINDKTTVMIACSLINDRRVFINLPLSSIYKPGAIELDRA